MPGRDEWTDIATGDPDELRERILTGFKAGKPFTPYIPTMTLPAPLESVLDFGCGVGRNFPYLKTVASHVDGFDLPPMIDRCRTLATEKIDNLISDWEDGRTRRYDLVFASLVLQHIDTGECRRYLTDFSRMAPHLYLLTRTRTDFDAVMLDLVAESNVYETGTCRIVDHDPLTNQLRVMGDLSFEDARCSSEDVHYELLLRARNPRQG